MTNLHPFGTIRPQDFPPAPKCPTGYRWIDSGQVNLIPTENWYSDYECDANTKKDDHTNYSRLESNLQINGFDHSFEPGYAVPISGTNKVSGKTARTRHKIFSNYGVKLYPVRLMEPVDGYDENISAFSAAFIADVSHKPARQLSMEQIAQQMWSQKEKKIPWYHGQTISTITGEPVYGDEEFDYAYDYAFKITQVFSHDIPKGKIKKMVERGFSTAVKINDKDEKQIKSEMKDHKLGNGSDGFKVSILVCDDAFANAPAKLWSIFNDPTSKIRHIIFTKNALTAEEVKKLRESWRKTLYSYAEMVISYSLTNKKYIASEVKKEVMREKIKELFANFELYGYNHLEDEKGPVRIDMFCEYA